MNAPESNRALVAQQAQPPQYEIAVSAAAAQAKAAVSARYEVALRRPRDWDNVRQMVLKECRRPSFAFDKSALYSKPVGNQKVTGLGVRFAEMALRCMTNVLVETETRYEDDLKEILRVTVTDLEANVTWPLDIPVAKTVERKKPQEGADIMGQRLNTYGETVFLVRATDDELLTKRAALISKAARTLAMRIIPGDLQSEAEDIIKAVRTAEAAKDPDAELKRILDGFARLRVMPNQLAAYLGHAVDQCSPAQLVDLRGLWSALDSGETTWASVMTAKREAEGGDDPKKPEPPVKPAAKPPAAPPPVTQAPPPADPPSPPPADDDLPWSDDPAPAPAPATAPLAPPPPAATTGEPASLGEKQNLKRVVAGKPGADMRMLLDLVGAIDVDAETLEGLTKEQFKLAKAKLA